MGQAIENKNFIESKISKHNLRKVQQFCKATSIIVLCVIGLKALQLTFFSELDFLRHLNLEPLFVILLTNGVILYLSKYYYKILNYEPTAIKRLTNIYVFSLMLAGVAITVSDIGIYNQLMLFSLIMIVASSYFVIERKQLLIAVLVNSTALLIGLYLQQGYTEQFQYQVLYLVILVPIAVYISGVYYRSFTDSLNVQLRLIEEIKSNKSLATELCAANYQLSLQASLDPMTGLFNRRALNEYMADIASKADDEAIHVSVLMMDVDYFKRYNDTYGHIAGDKVLVQVAQVLKSVSNKHGIFAARYGGEEFTIVLLDASEAMVQSLCETIMNDIEQLQIAHAGSEIDSYVTVSIGAYSQIAQNGAAVIDTLEHADRVLYDVKKNGRKGYQINFVVTSE